MSTNTPGNWDDALKELLAEAGIDPERSAPLTGAALRRHQLTKARPVILTATAATGADILLACSGAPTAASVPLVIWGFGWIGLATWRAAGSPSTVHSIDMTQRGITRAGTLTYRRIGRIVYPIHRRARAQVRAAHLRRINTAHTS